MFDIGALEILVIVVIAILVIGPKDMPVALRVAGRWVGKMRRASAQFRSGFDAIVREAEMEEMEKKWKAENARIMAETPAGEMDHVHDEAAAVPIEPTESSGDVTADMGEEPSPTGGNPLSAAAEPIADEPMLPLGKPQEN